MSMCSHARSSSKVHVTSRLCISEAQSGPDGRRFGDLLRAQGFLDLLLLHRAWCGNIIGRADAEPMNLNFPAFIPSRKTVIFVRALLLDAIEFRIEIRAIHRSSMILVDCKCGGHPGCRRVSPLNHQFPSFANKAEAPVFIRRTQPHQKPFTRSYWAL